MWFVVLLFGPHYSHCEPNPNGKNSEMFQASILLALPNS
jgi:hypothetical protein